MKKLLTLLFSLALLPGLQAQNKITPHQVTGSAPAYASFSGEAPAKVNAGLDTLNEYFVNASGFTIYGATGGYLFGTGYDGFGIPVIDATGLHFDSVGNVNVVGVYGWFARKALIGAPDILKCELYEAGPDSMPTTLLAFGTANMAFVDTNVSINFATLNGFQVFQLNQGLPEVNGDFFISMNNTGFDDTLGMVSTVQGDGLQQKRCRQLLNPNYGGTWTRVWDFWNISALPLDADPVFFPIIEFLDTSTAATQAFYSHDLKLYPVAPNPAEGDPVIRYEMEHPGEVQVWVLDATGKFIFNSGLRKEGAGMHEIRLSRENLASGTYYYTAKTARGSLSSRFVIP